MRIAALAIAFAGLASIGGAYAQTPASGDAAAGAVVFKKCAACHTIGEGAKSRIGPVLEDVVGRVAGTFPGFSYSAAMKKAGADGLVWTPPELATYLMDPKAKVPGNKMTFVGLKDQADIDNVIAYLIENSPHYVPAGAPAMAAEPAPAAPAQ